MAEGTTNGNSLHANPGPSGSLVITTNSQIESLETEEIEWELGTEGIDRILGELSDYRYWQLERVIRGIEAEKGWLRVERLFPG